ncbi:hypothetical protein FRUB_02371 [Fimbriiglobus ruber]|uniref:Uncharacterized protein n=1 Tax=Fimbriiglobus ruber TaxID=1908690 RepID=A0A225E4M5_9BACT|nr:hypothetical protein FRUB_02371 [Fimbriiglobus ruber]
MVLIFYDLRCSFIAGSCGPKRGGVFFARVFDGSGFLSYYP